MVLSHTRQWVLWVLCFILAQVGSSSNDRALHFGTYFNSQSRYEILSLSKKVSKFSPVISDEFWNSSYLFEIT